MEPRGNPAMKLKDEPNNWIGLVLILALILVFALVIHWAACRARLISCLASGPLEERGRRLEGWAASETVAILRDARLRRAPQDEVGECHLLPRCLGASIISRQPPGRVRMPGSARRHRPVTATIAAAMFTLLAATAARAQAYPTGPVRVVVPFGAGGATDVLARVFADQLQQRLGQPFTPENRGGAAGQIAATAVARSPADGSTLMFTTAAPITIAPLMNDKVQYDPRKTSCRSQWSR